MALLSPQAFAHVLEPLRGQHIGYVRPTGNVGDRLIEWGTFQLFDRWGLKWKVVDVDAPSPPEVDALVFAGGGSMGKFYIGNYELRGRALELGLPMTILPQSFVTPEDRRYYRVYIREKQSQQHCPSGILGPDMALGLEYQTTTRPRYDLGVFIRRDREAALRRPWGVRDPARVCKTPQEYLELAAQYKRVVTDRLHFAICGLILGRETTLLPNSYYKNQSMYETWLRDMGCQWAADLSEACGRVKTRFFHFILPWRSAAKAA